jgi:uncharacterized membrane-anchored protein
MGRTLKEVRCQKSRWSSELSRYWRQLGETGGDAVSMSMNLGYAVSSFVFISIFAVAVLAQILARKFHASLYWFVIVATTTAGTTMADFADRSLGIGYPGGAFLLFIR